MTLSTALAIFVAGFASVFTLGFQSRAVNAGNYMLAAAMSFTIAMFQSNLWKIIVQGDGSLLSSVIYGLSGACAITSAIWCHKKLSPVPKAKTP